MSIPFETERVITITPVSAAKSVFSVDGGDTYNFGTCNVTQNDPAVTPDTNAAWLTDTRVKMPRKFYKSGASSVEEYIATAMDSGTGELTLDRDYLEATDGAAAYVLTVPSPITRYVVKNNLAASQDMQVAEIDKDGTYGAYKTIKQNEVYSPPHRVNIVGLAYKRVSADGSAEVQFYHD